MIRRTLPPSPSVEDLADPDHPIWVQLYENQKRKPSVRLLLWVGRHRTRLLIAAWIVFAAATLGELIAFRAFSR